MRGDFGNANYPKHVARLLSDCVDTGKMTWQKLNGACHKLNGNATGRGGKLLILAHPVNDFTIL